MIVHPLLNTSLKEECFVFIFISVKLKYIMLALEEPRKKVLETIDRGNLF